MTSSNSIFLSFSCQVPCNVYFGYCHVVTLSDIDLSSSSPFLLLLPLFFIFSCGLPFSNSCKYALYSLYPSELYTSHIMYYIEAPSSCKICRIFISSA
ncbi:hypothetical protein BDV37DRAFT_178599 [Aspergillus pseudonomiae]|uniref:Uncharacterized protein n=1 Tax=Aspergillus pseudonomiae TaxID=1506151 RepID=A0A5N7D5L4_9EURO|nr:uncharacterized protein BDV37DRAFT_178599 [Aspergillus pseudonomiae]KAE8401589.1 hypothetical protein BDV37DRAFT_178599 [Aspergillus pseudonomiae]